MDTIDLTHKQANIKRFCSLGDIFFSQYNKLEFIMDFRKSNILVL